MLAKLTEKMRDFQYDPTRSFRAWLKTVTQRTLLDFVGSRQHRIGQGDDQAWEILNSLEARADLERQIEEAFDRELPDLATIQVRQRLSGQSDAFRSPRSRDSRGGRLATPRDAGCQRVHGQAPGAEVAPGGSP